MGTDFVSVIMELECERVIVLHSTEREGERGREENILECSEEL